MSQDYSVLNDLAIELLERLGNFSPSENEITLIENLISNTFLSKEIIVDERFTQYEFICLYLTVRGKTTKEIAKATKHSTSFVDKCYHQIKEKICRHAFEKDILQNVQLALLLPLAVASQRYCF